MFPGESCWRALGLVDRGRCVPLGGGAVAQLAAAVLAPDVEVAVRTECRRMVPAYADFFPNEFFRRALGLFDLDWCGPVGVGAVAQLASAIVSPGVEVAVRADGRGMKAAHAELAESDAALRGRGKGDLGAPGYGPLAGADGPMAVSLGPVGGEGDAAGDGLGEVVGDVALEPAVEQISVPGGVGAGPTGLAPVGDGLPANAAAACRVETDRPGCGGPGLDGISIAGSVERG